MLTHNLWECLAVGKFGKSSVILRQTQILFMIMAETIHFHYTVHSVPATCAIIISTLWHTTLSIC